MKSNHLLDLLRSNSLCTGVNGPHCLPTWKIQTPTVKLSEQHGIMTEVASGPRKGAKWDSIQENNKEMSFLPAIKPSRAGNGVNPEPLGRKNLYPRMSEYSWENSTAITGGKVIFPSKTGWQKKGIHQSWSSPRSPAAGQHRSATLYSPKNL